ncbi:hypothetical protein [Kiloniella sp. b19]|uniref:hypothetical protein n=1 Tax=Kiloniella sp. GXU_MW_B19 TaxID=3141326 RepID=UPI0031DC1FE3
MLSSLTFPFRAGLSVGLLAVLAACGSAPDQTKPVADIPAAETEQLEPETLEKQEAERETDRPEQPELPDFDLKPESYRGLDPAEIRDVLGSAVLERSEPPGLLLQFHAEDCVLDVVFYDGLSSYLEARDRAVKKVKLEECLKALLTAEYLRKNAVQPASR